MDDCLEWASQSHTSSSSCSSILQNYKPSSSLFTANADSVTNGYQVDDIIILGSSVLEKNPLVISQSHRQNLFQHFVGRGLMEQSTPNQILNCQLELSNDDDQDQILNTTTTTTGGDDHRMVISGNQLLVNEPVIGHHHHGYGGGGMNGRGGSCSRSMESLECLLSSGGTNGNTENSTNIEDDDGISMIFSHENCKSLWNSVVVSSSSGAGGCCNDSSINNNNNEKQSTINQKRGFSETNTVEDDGFHLISENPQKLKRARSISSTSENRRRPSSSNINFQLQPSPVSSTTTTNSGNGGEPDSEAIAQMKEMIYRAAAFRPVNFGTEETVEKPKRKNVRISSDPQTVAARQRRERISEKIRVLQRLVPGGNKMDTASMLDEAANYLKFLRSQVKALEAMGGGQQKRGGGGGDQQQTAVTNLPFSSIPFNHSLLFPMQSSCFLPMQYPNS